MAVIAIVTTCYVCRMLACCRGAVMARPAGAQDLRMVDSVCGREDIRVVTIFTNVACLYMRRAFANRINTVMAAGTIVEDAEVVESRRPPGNSRMAIIASIAACYVCRMFACCNEAIVAGVAGTNNLCMVHGEDRGEDVGIVAILANIAGLNMRQILANGMDTVMAVNAIA